MLKYIIKKKYLKDFWVGSNNGKKFEKLSSHLGLVLSGPRTGQNLGRVSSPIPEQFKVSSELTTPSAPPLPTSCSPFPKTIPFLHGA